MVDDDETKDLITWTGSGDQFTVFNNVDFSRTVLPRYFKHCNWSSFVRQLNSKFNLLFDFFYYNNNYIVYDFHKINEQNEDGSFNNENENMAQKWDFKHPWFTKTGYDRLHKIRRKPPRNRLIPQMRYSNAMELVDDDLEVDSENTLTSSALPSVLSQSQSQSQSTTATTLNSASSATQSPSKPDEVQSLVSQLHDTTRNFETKLDYTCNEIMYLRSVVDNQQMVGILMIYQIKRD